MERHFAKGKTRISPECSAAKFGVNSAPQIKRDYLAPIVPLAL
jgi:hypothetical protein